MFDQQTLNEVAPVQIERRQINLEQWRADVAREGKARGAAGVALGRLFRQAYAALPKADARREIEAQGFTPISAAGLMRQAAKADGEEVHDKRGPRVKRLSLDDAKEMLASLEAGDVQDVIDALKEVTREVS